MIRTASGWNSAFGRHIKNLVQVTRGPDQTYKLVHCEAISVFKTEDFTPLLDLSREQQLDLIACKSARKLPGYWKTKIVRPKDEAVDDVADALRQLCRACRMGAGRQGDWLSLQLDHTIAQEWIVSLPSTDALEAVS